MYINDIKIQNFRNYDEQIINLDKNINVFYGDNAQGKTNIIETVFLCAFGKSFRTNKDKELIKKDKLYANIEVNFQKKDRDGIVKIQLNDKKNIFLNSVKLKRLSELLGNINVVLFTPDDINILKDGPSSRRKFLDMMIGQLRPQYIHTLNLYLNVLEQRNNFLKQKVNDSNMMEIWDTKLAEYGEIIYNYRNEYIEKIKSKIKNIHLEITDEDIEIEYISDCKTKENFLKKLEKNFNIDKIKGYTSSGIHRDDFKVFINGEEVNIYGSQGQNRTAILSLKLSELQVIYDEIGEYPILLLDDFMSELDEKRRTKLLENIKDTQVIITCTDEININNSKIFYVEKRRSKRKKLICKKHLQNICYL